MKLNQENNWGGKRHGAGRPKGSLGAAGKARLLIANRPSGVSPLAFMLAVMRDENQPRDVRDRMAVAAAPYCHVRMGREGSGKV